MASRLSSKQFFVLSVFQYSPIRTTAFVEVQIALVEIIETKGDLEDTVTELKAFASVRAFLPASFVWFY